MVIGAARAIGRYSQDEQNNLFLHLFPSPSPPPSADVSQGVGGQEPSTSATGSLSNSRTGSLAKKNTITNLQTLLPTPGGITSSSTWTGGLNSRESGTDLLSLAGTLPHSRYSSFQSQNPGSVNNKNQSHQFFYTFGSCFSQVKRNSLRPFVTKDFDLEKPCKFNQEQLHTVLDLAKKVLEKELLGAIDEIVTEVINVRVVHLIITPR